jgi:hypothetical protein
MVITAWCYSWIPNKEGKTWVRMPEIVRLPLVFYLYFIISWAVGKVALAFQQGLRAVIYKTGQKQFWRCLLLSSAVLIYVLHIASAVAVEYGDLKMKLTYFSLMFDAIFICGCTFSFVFLDEYNYWRQQI